MAVDFANLVAQPCFACSKSKESGKPGHEGENLKLLACASDRELFSPAVVKNHTPTRILLIDDHALFREGLARIIANAPDFSVAGATGNCQEAEEILARKKTDLVLLDLYLEAENALSKIASWRSRFPTISIVVVSGTTNPAIARQAIANGAAGFISKLESSSELLRSIRKVLAGNNVSSKNMEAVLPPMEASLGRDLSQRETEILQEIAAGHPVRVIAENFAISTKTVERHKENIKEKLNLENASELMREALRRFPFVP